MNEPCEERDPMLRKRKVLQGGQLRNGNPSGDLTTVPRCAARARSRGGQPCQAPAMHGKRRCRLHGGLSTGPRTPEGLARSRRARWKHGRYSQAAAEQSRREAELAEMDREAQAFAVAYVRRLLSRRP